MMEIANTVGELMTNNQFLMRVKNRCLLFLAILPSLVQAEIVTDGSVGIASSLSGPNYAITQSLGQTNGQNLFHSFSLFNLNQNETATFSGTANIQNIISRVTGGDVSQINGKLQSTIQGANLYLLNPSGIIFGEHASLDLSGSFHASSADYLTFSDGSKFYTQSLASDVLSSSSPESFGFLDNKTVFKADIESHGSHLSVAEGKTISLVGHNLMLDKQTDIYVPSGQINLAAINGKGEVAIDLSSNLQNQANTSGFIQIKDGTTIEVSNNTQLGAGTVIIKGGIFSLSNESHIYSVNDSSQDAKTISISADSINISDQSGIASITKSQGKGSDIKLNATNDVHISNSNSTNADGIIASTTGKGNSGNIDIYANKINLTGKSNIDMATFGNGNAGIVNLVAKDAVKLIGSSRIFADSHGSGKGGTINIQAASLNIEEKSGIDVGSFALGDGGNINIKLSNDMTMSDNSRIYADTSDLGQGGKISIIAKNLYLDGNRDVSSGLVENNSGSSIDTSSKASSYDKVQQQNIFSQKGSGNAGKVDIIVTNTIKLKGGSSIYTESLWDNSKNKGSTGNAGTIDIQANTIHLLEGSNISSQAVNSGGGAITLTAKNELYLLQSRVSSSVQQSTGNGGDISIEGKNYVILNRGQIVAQAFQGNGGNISIKTNDYIASQSSVVNASSQLGIDGTVIIDSPSIDTDASVPTLSTRYLDTKQWQYEPCSNKVASKTSSFVIHQHKGVGLSPDDMMVSDIDDLVSDELYGDVSFEMNNDNLQQLGYLAKIKCQQVL